MSFHVKTKEQVRKVGQYILGETLRKDGYWWTQKGVDEKTKIPVALKFMMRHNKQSFQEKLKEVHTEIMSLIKIDNPHVIKLFAYNLHYKYPEKNGKILNTILLVLEHCPGGNLFDILYYAHQFDSVTARTYFIQMLKGLKACHNAGVVHCDIKPQNLLLDRRYQLKITDFGMSFNAQKKDFEGMLIKTSYVGTQSYQAPELLKGKKYTKASDIFSCGVVLFILLTGDLPFEEARREDKWYRPMCESNPAAFWELHSKAKIDDDCKDLLTGMLAYRARERLTLDECLNHKWLAGRKTHNPQELAALVNEKHKQTRIRRRKNWTKMKDLEKSVKQRKRILWNLKKWQNAHVCCPCCNSSWDVSSSKRTLPVVENFVPNFLTFFAWKFQLHEAYDAAVNVFNVALQGKSHTVNSPGSNPWDVTTFIKVSNGVFEQEFAVSLSIREIKGTGIVAFKYNRFLGDSISFARIWDAAEECLMSYSQNLFFDSLDEQIMMEEDNNEQSQFLALAVI